MSALETGLSIALGIALAAATGFRLFIPLLVASVAAWSGHLPLNEGFAWLGSTPAMTMLAIAAVAEVLAYYVPVVDNLLDTIATPAALVAGTILSAAVMTDLPPLVKWTAAIVAGGGAAGITQILTTLVRAKSTAFTGGLANPVVATAEAGGAVTVSLLALAAPFLALLAIIGALLLVIRASRRWRTRT